MSWSEIVPHRVITVGRNSGNRALIDNALARHGLQLNWSYDVAHISGSLGSVEAGLGVAVLPRLATPAAGHPIIHTIQLAEPEVSRTIGIVRGTGRRCPLMPANFSRRSSKHGVRRLGHQSESVAARS
ncbi:LysR substrate-binding domain-containing protein [Bradyrhizobium japonicum]|uniref:LysR substrate-binding domain-containing protein n=1 Tax=Bradyrhizobium japonicum TaxID=375 RepID=UPI002898DC27|nr:LysR substrate-binding domain-containing protein [Bradyrhizobium japonicum]